MLNALSSRPSKPQPDNRLKFFYGLGSFAFGVKDSGFGSLLLLFYNQVMGLPAALVGAALMVALVVDACIDPLIGQLSDNLHSRWGRRHPFMYLAALPVAAAFVALWNPPTHVSQSHLFFYLLALAVGVRIFISFYEIPSSALAAEFSGDYDDRSILLSYRYFFALLGSLTLLYAAFAVFLTPDALHKVGQLNPTGYGRYGLAAGAAMAVTILASTLGTHKYIPTLAKPARRPKPPLRQVLAEISATLSNSSLLFLLLSSIATAMASGVAASLTTYFGTFFWELTSHQISIMVLGIYASAVVALVSTPHVARRFGKRGLARMLMVLSAACGIGPILLRLLGLMPPNHSAALFWIIFGTTTCSQVFAAISTTMAGSMIADLVEATELQTGRRSEGLLFSVSAFVGKAVSGFGVLTASVIIEVVHLKGGAQPGAVPPDVLRNLALVYCPALVVLHAAAFVLLGGYKITRSSHEDTLRRLAVTKAELGAAEVTATPEPQAGAEAPIAAPSIIEPQAS